MIRLWRFKPDGSFLREEEFDDIAPERAFAPHCDQSILHAPGECVHCDHYPDWQESRHVQRINYTNGTDANKSPCPSEYFRDPKVRDRWVGNVARKENS